MLGHGKQVKDPKIVQRCCMAAANVVAGYSKARNFAAMEQVRQQATDMANRFLTNDHADIAIAQQCAMAARNAAFAYGEINDTEAMERVRSDLVELAKHFPGDIRIAQQCALAAINAMVNYGAGNAPAIGRLWSEIEAIGKCFPDDETIAFCIAKSSGVAAHTYFKAGNDLDARRALSSLALIARRFPASTIIQELANYLNLSYAAQHASGWPYGQPDNDMNVPDFGASSA